jgi:UDP-galactopyranose mutase
MKEEFDILMVGAGISGITLAERFSSIGKKVLVIDKRDHIGGNCYDFFDENGVIVPLYGPHYFHTEYEDVWNYVHQFSEFVPYKLRVLSNIDGQKLVPFPINIDTVNMIFKTKIKNEKEMVDWLESNKEDIKNPKNSEESAISRMGKRLYEIFVRNYVKKQWDMWPSELGPEVLNRIPVRTDFNEYYFSDKYQGMPKNGYTELFKNMIQNKNITVKLNTNFFDLERENFKMIIFTGRVDDYFKNKGFDKLQYRSMKFEFETINSEYFQEVGVVVFPNTEKFTRITEPKHSNIQKTEKTTIIKEYPTWDEEPYYPVLSQKNKDLYLKYQDLAKYEKKTFFVGRLAQYKYFDMDDSFKNAIDLFEKIKDKV